jgi:hypothetical protein
MYKIKLKNRFGTYLSAPFKSKAKAMSVLKASRYSDKQVGGRGLTNIYTGSRLRMTNRYSLVKSK